MIQKESYLEVADNSGAKEFKMYSYCWKHTKAICLFR